jgi:hypothetical protein
MNTTITKQEQIEIEAQKALVLFERARSTLAKASTVDEVQKIRNQAVAIAAYARMANDDHLEINARKIRLRASRRLGEMLKEQKEKHGLNKGGRPSKTGLTDKPLSPPTLESQGIDKNLLHEAHTLAAMPEQEFEAALDAPKPPRKPHRSQSPVLQSNSVEHYTPARYIESARKVLETIDLDPASCEEANKTVCALKFYDAQSNGLKNQWRGRVWLNLTASRNTRPLSCEAACAEWATRQQSGDRDG